MYSVKWTEDGNEMVRSFEDREDAFKFQSGLLARRIVGADGSANIVTHGVWHG